MRMVVVFMLVIRGRVVRTCCGRCVAFTVLLGIVCDLCRSLVIMLRGLGRGTYGRVVSVRLWRLSTWL